MLGIFVFLKSVLSEAILRYRNVISDFGFLYSVLYRYSFSILTLLYLIHILFRNSHSTYCSPRSIRSCYNWPLRITSSSKSFILSNILHNLSITYIYTLLHLYCLFCCPSEKKNHIPCRCVFNETQLSCLLSSLILLRALFIRIQIRFFFIYVAN